MHSFHSQHLYCIIFLLFSFFYACSPSSSNDRTAAEDFNGLQNIFTAPPSEFRTVPFCVWNGKVTVQEVIRMLEDLKNAGAGGGIIHPRPGLVNEYLSEDWFRLFESAVQFGKENDMKIWIYDENSWPSGCAGGHVPAEMPESYNQGQGLQQSRQNVLPDKTDNYFIILKKEGEKWTDITGKTSAYQGIKGDYYLYRKTFFKNDVVHGGFPYVDLLAKGVTEKFLEITMSGYEKNHKEDFGKTIPGIFTDEPGIGTSGGLRWTPDLFSTFQKRWGYDLKTVLPCLEEETGDWKKVRHNYMAVLLQLFIERWSKPYHDHCEKAGLKWTGHYWEHIWPLMNHGGPDNMAIYSWHQQPGIDLLAKQFDEEHVRTQFGNIRAVKELRSTANQMGFKRTLCEIYGGGGLDEGFKDFKRLGDWAFVLGINFMNQHLSPMTISGARKYDFPPAFSYHSPWWQDYRSLNDYYARLSAALSYGEQDNEILVIEPNTTLSCYYSHAARNPKVMKQGNTVHKFITQAEKSQIEYDLGSEYLMKEYGSVSKGKLKVGKADYSMIVLPPCTENLNRSTYELLKEFVAAGGKLVCYSRPVRIDGEETDEMEPFFSQNGICHKSADDRDFTEMHRFSRNRFRFSGGNLYHQSRQLKDGELVFLVNSSMKESVDGNLCNKGKHVLELDAENGKIFSYPSTSRQDSSLVRFHIEPAGSLLLFFSYPAQPVKKFPQEPVRAGNRKMSACSPLSVQRLGDNVFTIDFCDLTTAEGTPQHLYVTDAADKVFQQHGFIEGNPWNSAVQYKKNITDRDTFSSGGFSARYHFDIKEDFDFSEIRLVAEHPELSRIEINGKPVRPLPGQWWLDRSFGVYPIGNHIKKGTNEVELEIRPMSIFAEIEPVFLIGDFSVNPEDTGWSIGTPIKEFHYGSWKAQGQPFYPGTFSYTKEWNIEKTDIPYAVQLNKWNGTVAEVYVNGGKKGIIYSEPYRLEIGRYLRKGTNKIEVRVIGSNKNLLGPFYKKAESMVCPNDWKNIKEEIPGNSYQLPDYGLLEDFDLVF